MNYLKLLSVSILTWALVACGGGGTPGVDPTKPVAAPTLALYLTAPSAVTIGVGAAPSYTIGGGTGPYLASSSNTGIAMASVSGTSLTVAGIAAGTAQVRVSDATGTAVLVAVTVGSGGAATLYMTAPTSIAVAPGANSSYTVGGGTAPYLVSSSNTAVATAGVVGTALTISGVAPGTAQITVFDANGNSVSTSATVDYGASALYMNAPGAVSIAIGASSSYAFGGGKSPYSVSSSNMAVATASVSGLTLTINGVAAGTAQIIVFDSTGKSVSTTVTVGTGSAGTPLFMTAPSAVTIAVGAAPSYTLGGGVAPYTVSSSNAVIARGSVTSATVLTISGLAAGTAQITVFDAVGSSVSTSVTVGSGGVPAPSISLDLRDASNFSTRAVSASGVTTARATVLDAAGSPVVGKLVVFTADAALVRFSSPASGLVLTDSNGVASQQLSPASITAAGAGTLTAATVVASAALTTSFDYQLSVANLTLQALTGVATPLPAYGNREVSTIASVNGVVATAVPVQVSFSASCGTVSPALVTTDATGKAATTYKADSATCAGSNVTLMAASPGATTVTGTLAVQATVGTNLLFVSATPQRIYLAGSVGATQALIGFRLVDANGNALQNQAVQLSLSNTATGVSIGTLGNTAAVSLTTDADGMVSVAVFSGTVPGSVQVTASLVANAAVTTTSNTLTVASGRPVPSRISLAASVFAIEGWSIDGNTSQITLSMADRQGNPVPDGTEVNFVTSGGVMVPPSCVVSGGASRCSVEIRSGNPRPANGRVAILAYVPGEEDFVDANGNNVYNAGETFTDLGNAYRDDNQSGAYDLGEFFVPRAGATVCAGGVNGKANTCDGVWGAVDMRAQAIVIFASSGAVISVVSPPASASGFSIRVADVNGNSMPTGTTISAAARARVGSTCSVTSVVPAVVPNTTLPVDASILLAGCGPLDTIDYKTSSPAGWETGGFVTFP